ncbi:MAG: aminotransferase class I/II-fold pyridoxal phosphate-dependent enzyme, partial [Myxococcales bacterium]|nr:aminotransferase class I/II-fold pyridoxal phosphate-dependent enzyme [Myxococcales bacterium]
RTFSKAYGLAGLRVGYAVCEPQLADYLNRVRDPFNVNLVAQAAAVAALADDAWLQQVVAETVRQRETLTKALAARGLSVTPSQTNFVLFDTGRNAKEVNDALMRRGVIARPVGPSGLPTHLRVTVGKAGDNQRFLEALDAVL